MNNRILFNRGTSTEAVLEADRIISVVLDEIISPSEGISIGAACANKLVAEIIPPAGLAFATATIEPYAVEGESQIPLGKFFVCDVSTSNDYKTVTLECYDMFCRLEKPYEPSQDLKFPASIGEIVSDMASQEGFETDADFKDFEDYVISAAGGLTCRKLLGYIAGMMGTNASFGRDGKLRFRWYRESQTLISRSMQYQDQPKLLTDEAFTILSLTSGSGEETFTCGSGPGISFENPYISMEQLHLIMDKIGNLSFRPCTVKCRGNLDIEPGQIIRLEGRDAEEISICVMEQVLTFNGGLQSEIFCYGKSDVAYSFEKTTATSVLNRLNERFKRAVIMGKEINNPGGGVFEIIDDDGDGINESFVLRLAGEGGNYIRGNHEGIGFSRDGGNTYTTAINQDGICTEAVNAQELWAAQLGIEGVNPGDVFSVEACEDGHITLTIGSGSNSILLKQKNSEIGFYLREETAGDPLCRLTPDSFEMETINTVKFGTLCIFPDANGKVIFSTGGNQ